jgi:hypothetical protein
MLWKLGRDTFVVVVSAVKAALQLVWAFILALDLVVERSDIRRDFSRCNCGSRSQKRGEDGGREIHDGEELRE